MKDILSPLFWAPLPALINVTSEKRISQNVLNNRSLHKVNEDYERHFGAIILSVVVYQQVSVDLPSP